MHEHYVQPDKDDNTPKALRPAQELAGATPSVQI